MPRTPQLLDLVAASDACRDALEQARALPDLRQLPPHFTPPFAVHAAHLLTAEQHAERLLPAAQDRFRAVSRFEPVQFSRQEYALTAHEAAIDLANWTWFNFGPYCGGPPEPKPAAVFEKIAAHMALERQTACLHAQPVGPPAAPPLLVRPVKRKNIDALMALEVQSNLECVGWSSAQWAGHLGCSEGTVRGTSTWQGILRKLREQQALAGAERMDTSRTHPKGRRVKRPA